MNNAESISPEALDRIAARMERIDNLPQPIRLLIHEYGWAAVKEIMDLGVKEPRRIEHIIYTVRFARCPDSNAPLVFPHRRRA